MDKKVVNCVVFESQPVKVGQIAKINTLDHPNLSNKTIFDGCLVFTSEVVSVFDGGFETKNTIYKVLEQLNG